MIFAAEADVGYPSLRDFNVPNLLPRLVKYKHPLPVRNKLP